MPLFRLAPFPEQSGHRDWAASTYGGECRVAAENPRMARLYASAAFGIATARGEGPVRTPPWTNDGLVECTEIAHIAGAMPPDGMVLLPETSDRPDFMTKGPDAGEVWKPR